MMSIMMMMIMIILPQLREMLYWMRNRVNELLLWVLNNKRRFVKPKLYRIQQQLQLQLPPWWWRRRRRRRRRGNHNHGTVTHRTRPWMIVMTMTKTKRRMTPIWMVTTTTTIIIIIATFNMRIGLTMVNMSTWSIRPSWGYHRKMKLSLPPWWRDGIWLLVLLVVIVTINIPHNQHWPIWYWKKSHKKNSSNNNVGIEIIMMMMVIMTWCLNHQMNYHPKSLRYIPILEKYYPDTHRGNYRKPLR